MRFGAWKVGDLHRTSSMKTVARELGKYKLDLLGCIECAEDYMFFYRVKLRRMK
jgi:hypothetical protein